MSKIHVKSVTIDQLDPESHRRYARDVQMLDVRYIQDSPAISQHSEVTAIDSTYSSRLEMFWELHACNIPWAHFTEPPLYRHMRRKQLFHRMLLPNLTIKVSYRDVDGLDDVSGDSEQAVYSSSERDSENQDHKGKDEEETDKLTERLKKILSKMKETRETERGALLGMLEVVDRLEDMIQYIYEKKLQFQKG